MKRSVLVAVGLVFVLGADEAARDAEKRDLAKFTGSWQAVSVETDGKQLPKAEVEKVRLGEGETA